MFYDLNEVNNNYRTRRVERTEGGTTTKFVFSGGTEVQELNNGATYPSVEYVRGSDYGGGIGGILYTVRGGFPSFNHYNRRGDVTTQTNGTGQITYQAAYEAFGTRTQEVGNTADRQKANTKDEEPTLKLLNEGFRYRDLETGTFITRDPLGFVDGPNMYAYVVQNPWTKFDPEGLEEKDPDKKEQKTSSYKAYMVARPLMTGKTPKEQENLNKKFENKELAHIYIMFEKDGEPISTYSWHPESWATGAINSNEKEKGRVWANAPEDINPVKSQKVLIVKNFFGITSFLIIVIVRFLRDFIFETVFFSLLRRTLLLAYGVTGISDHRLQRV